MGSGTSSPPASTLAQCSHWGRDAELKTAPPEAAQPFIPGVQGEATGDRRGCLPLLAAAAGCSCTAASCPHRSSSQTRVRGRSSSSSTDSARSSSPCPKGQATSLPPPHHAVVLGAKARPGNPSKRRHFIRPPAPLWQHVAALMGLSIMEWWGKRILVRN